MSEKPMSWTQSTIVLMRHGEPLANGQPQTEQIFRGITDDTLSTNGWLQMEKAVKQLQRIDNIISSPLLRCSEFARKLSEQQGVSLQQVDALREINFGLWDGQSVQQIASEFGQELKGFWQNPLENTPSGGESVLDFQQRVTAFWQNFLITNKEKNSLIITHGGVQKIILAKVLAMPVQALHNIEVPYACCSKIHVYHSDSEIITTLKSHGV